MTIEAFISIENTFDKNQKSVTELLNFDRFILDFCLMHIQGLEAALKHNSEIKLTSLHYLPTNTIAILKGIRENDSLRKEYEGMFNQCLVLTVSHFSSSIHSIFKEAINYASCCCPDLLAATGEDIKISFEELKSYHFNLTDGLGELVVKKKDISFQDMQSINRAFKSFFHIDIEKDVATNDIILAQASRHSVVHAQNIADEKFIKQIKDAIPRNVKQDVLLDQHIQFSPAEIEMIQSSMNVYITRLIQKLENRILKD